MLVLILVFIAALKLAFPDIHQHVGWHTQQLCSRPARQIKGLPVLLQRPFHNLVYPTFTINFRPRTCTYAHRDKSNSAGVPCAITALGNYDPNFGGHLVLDDLKLIIRFPPGSTILIPSASFTHGNIPIQEGETRTSFTQYCPGGLLRWVDWGFCRWDQMSADEQTAVRTANEERFEQVLARFSTPEELHAR
jgi:hypothetical protein